MTIYKYSLGNASTQVIEMPLDAEILTVQLQGGIVCLWVRVDPEALTVLRTIKVVGTGQEIGANDKYIGTIQQSLFVWHIFEVRK